MIKTFEKSGTYQLTIKEVCDNISELLPSLKSKVYLGDWEVKK